MTQERELPTPRTRAIYGKSIDVAHLLCAELEQELAAAKAALAEDADEVRKYRLLHWLIGQDVIICGGFIYDPDDRNPRNIGFALMMNDTFYYASADAEPFSLDQVDEIAAVYKTWGNSGLVAWASLQRGQDPLKGLADKDFLEARTAIAAERAALLAQSEGK